MTRNQWAEVRSALAIGAVGLSFFGAWFYMISIDHGFIGFFFAAFLGCFEIAIIEATGFAE